MAGWRARATVARQPALAERLYVAVAAGAAVALIAYALLQLAGPSVALAPPKDVIPLFWRLKISAITSAVAAPGLWRLGGMDQGPRSWVLRALLLGAVGAIAACAVLSP